MKCLIAVLTLIYATLGQSRSTAVISLLPDTSKIKFAAFAELGYLGVIDHKVQFGQNTTYFDYQKDGGQSTLFPISRFSLEIDFKEKNTLIFLYQPLELNTSVVLGQETQIDNVTFPQGTNLDLTYSFPFYRVSYLRNFKTSNDNFKISAGLSLQIRNAVINFESADGKLRKITRDVGPVPILKFRSAYRQSETFELEVELDGMYAPISVLNGSTNEVVGAILDASIRQKVRITDHVDAYLNARYLGGGAVGTSDDTSEISDGYTKNWLHFFTLTTGFRYEF